MKRFFFMAAMVIAGVAQTGVVHAGSEQRCSIPVENSFTIHFERTQGIGDFKGFPALDLDVQKLSAAQRRHLRQLIQEAQFFKLSSTKIQGDVIPPDPPAGYTLTIEMDGRKHSIWITDGDVSESLQPLINWLREQVNREGAKEKLPELGCPINR
jgi:hypothetical protein